MKSLTKILSLFALFFLSACAETQFGAHLAKNMERDTQSQGMYKVGTPYLIDGQEYYPQENFEYTETGIASWYGPGFHGNKTANGERFDSNELTAAHRTLQLPSLVRVTNLDNGRAVVLRVNDRGPYARGRVIDVSAKAAELLGFKSKGTAKVRVETLPAESRRIAADAKAGRDTRGYEVALNNNPPPQTANTPVTLYPSPTAVSIQTSTPENTTGVARVSSVESVSLEPSRLEPVQGHISNDGRFLPNPVVSQQPVASANNVFIQAGAFSDSSNAQRLSDRLKAFGEARVYSTTVGGKSFYRVRLGPYFSVDQADAALGQMTGSGGVPNAKIVIE